MGAPEKLREKIAIATIVAPPTTGVAIAPAIIVEPTTTGVIAPEETLAPATAGDLVNPTITQMMTSHHATNRLIGSKSACRQRPSNG